MSPTFKWGIKPSIDDHFGQINASRTRSESKNVRINALAGELCAIGFATNNRMYNFNLIDDDG
jgi:hypothetical protein